MKSILDAPLRNSDISSCSLPRGRALDRNDQLRGTLQVGGSWTACQRHIDAVKEHALLRGHDIDFKLTRTTGPANQDCQTESAFDTLLVRKVEELVTFGPRARGQAHLRNGGQHVTPEVFHDWLKQHKSGNTDVVLLDARNIYESRIGYFQAVCAKVAMYIQFGTSAAQPNFSPNLGNFHNFRANNGCSHLYQAQEQWRSAPVGCWCHARGQLTPCVERSSKQLTVDP
jgi:hypothetical protein